MGQEMGLLELRQRPHLPLRFPLWSPAWGRARVTCAWLEQGLGVGLKCGGQSWAERSREPLISPQKPPFMFLGLRRLPNPPGCMLLTLWVRMWPTALLWEAPGQVWEMQVCSSHCQWLRWG